MAVIDREARDAIITVLCSQALADHLGDVRDAEQILWRLLGVPDLSSYDSDSPWVITRARLQQAGLPLPAHLMGDDDG